MLYCVLILLFIAAVITARGYLMYLASKNPEHLE